VYPDTSRIALRYTIATGDSATSVVANQFVISQSLTGFSRRNAFKLGPSDSSETRCLVSNRPMLGYELEDLPCTRRGRRAAPAVGLRRRRQRTKIRRGRVVSDGGLDGRQRAGAAEEQAEGLAGVEEAWWWWLRRRQSVRNENPALTTRLRTTL
jgi:hypothetical protein